MQAGPTFLNQIDHIMTCPDMSSNLTMITGKLYLTKDFVSCPLKCAGYIREVTVHPKNYKVHAVYDFIFS